MATEEVRFDQVKVLVGDGESPEVFEKTCMLNLNKAFTLTNNMQDDEIPDCTDETKPAGIRRVVRSQDIDISGNGKIHQPKLAMMVNWWKDAEKKNIRLEFGAAPNGLRATAQFYLATFEVSADFASTGEVSISLMPADTRDLAFVALS